MSFQDELSTFVEGYKRQLDASRAVGDATSKISSGVTSTSVGFPSQVPGVLAPNRNPTYSPMQWPLSLGVLSSAVVHAGPTSSTAYDFPGGNYTIYYLSGAANYSTAAPGLWGVCAFAGDGVTQQGPKITYNGGSGFVGNFGYYASSAIAEAASAGKFLDFTHTGGDISMSFIDEDYSDNAGGPILFNLIGPY